MTLIQKYLFLFLRYSWLAVLLVAAAVGIAWVRTSRQTPVYGSTAVLEVIPMQQDVLNIRDLQDNRIASLDAINTVVETLTSNSVMLNVAEAIKRRQQWEADSPAGKISADLESGLAQSVRSQVQVSLKRGTRLIEIKAEDGSPEMAQKIADETVKQFLKLENVDLEGSSEETVKTLREQQKQLSEKLNESLKSRDEFAAKHDIKSEQVAMTSQQSEALSTQVSAISSKRLAIETDIEGIKRAGGDGLEDVLRLPSVAALPDVAALHRAVIEREAMFAALKERYLEKHPRYIEALSGLEDLRSKLKSAVANAGETLQRQLEALTKEESRLKSRQNEESLASSKGSTVFAQYQALQRAVETDQSLYEGVGKRLKELELLKDIKKAPYKYTSVALVNPVALRPDKQAASLNAGLLGLGLAIGLILLIDRLDASIRTVDEAERQLGLPILAAVPEGNTSQLPPGGTVVTDAPGSAQAESFRTLRAALSMTAEESKRRIILVTSAIPSEGKTFNSINLAACLATQGLRTLLIDGDLRRPALTASLIERDARKSEDYKGLTDLLSGNAKLQETVRSTSVANLYLLPAGHRAPNPSELLAQPAFPALIAHLAGQFDRVVLDSAPINAVSDTLGFAAHAHTVVVVFRFGKTPSRAILRALQLLKKAGAKIGGAVMNRVPLGRGASYYYYYYGDTYLGDNNMKKKRRLAPDKKSDLV